MFFFFFGCAGSVAVPRLFSSCGEWELPVVLRLLIVVASLVAEQGSREFSLQQLQLPSSRAQSQSIVAPQHVGSSGTSDRTHVSCFGRRILKPKAVFLILVFFLSVYLTLEVIAFAC